MNGQEISIIKIANGWIVSAPVSYEDSIGGMGTSRYRDLMLDIASQVQSVKEPILRMNEEQQVKQETPEQSVVTIIQPRIGEFFFSSLNDACAFIAVTFQ